MKMTINPLNQKSLKPEISLASREIDKTGEYRYNIVIDRRLMAKYQALCKYRQVSPQDEIKKFIVRELKRYDDLI